MNMNPYNETDSHTNTEGLPEVWAPMLTPCGSLYVSFIESK